jgi:hypothetical protein
MGLTKKIALLLVTTTSIGASVKFACAGEGASSNYFPGAYGNLLVAVAPEPGPVAVSLNLFYKGKTDFAVRQGRLDTGLTATAFYSLAQGLYVWDAPEIGGRFAIGAYIPYGYSRVKGDVETRLGVVRFDESVDGLGDVGLIPLSFFWNTDNFHFNIYELIIAPTGKYELDEMVFVGRNYWSFDTVLAATWFDPTTGTELSAAGGIMVNSINNATEYRTGSEFHLGFTANQFVTEELALGLRGYVYQQLTGDSGSGALLGGCKGESVGGGFDFSWVPGAFGGKLAVTGSWVRDLHAKRRLKADYATVSIASTF